MIDFWRRYNTVKKIFAILLTLTLLMGTAQGLLYLVSFLLLNIPVFLHNILEAAQAMV